MEDGLEILILISENFEDTVKFCDLRLFFCTNIMLSGIPVYVFFKDISTQLTRLRHCGMLLLKISLTTMGCGQHNLFIFDKLML